MILPLLAGFAEGAGKEFSGIAEKERANKMQNDRLVAGALLDKLKDPTLSPEDHDNISRQYYKTLGVKGGDIEQIMQAHNYMRQAAQDHVAQNGPPPGNSDDPGNSLGTIPIQGGAGAQGGQGAFGQIPSMPVMPPHRQTIGDLKEDQQNRTDFIKGLTASFLKSTTDAAEQHAKITNADAELKSRGLDPLSHNEIRNMVGAADKVRQMQAGFVPGFVLGKDAIAEKKAAGLPPNTSEGTPMEEGALYKRAKDNTGSSTSNFSTAAVKFNPAEFVYDPETKTYNHFYRNPYTQQIEFTAQNVLPPSGYLPQENTVTGEHQQAIFDQNNVLQTPTLTNSHTNTTQRTLPGQAPGQVPPSGPRSTSGGGLSNAQPVTSPSAPGPLGAIPSAPPGLGGPIATGAPDPYSNKVKVGTPVFGGGIRKPLTSEEFQNLNKANSALDAIANIETILNSPTGMRQLALGGLPGSIGGSKLDVIIGHLRDSIERMQSGKVLNESEQTFYLHQLPNALDFLREKAEPGLIKEKLDMYKNLFNSVVQQYGRRAAGEQGHFVVDQDKIPTTPRTSTKATPASPLPSNPDTKIEVKAPDGTLGEMTQTQIDAAKKKGRIYTPTGK